MSFARDYPATEPTRADIDATAAPVLIEFGTSWCGYCQGAQASIAQAVSAHPQLDHRKVEDGRGKPLGRSFGVKLWPTLVLMKGGQELGRRVRPAGATEVATLLALLPAAG